MIFDDVIADETNWLCPATNTYIYIIKHNYVFHTIYIIYMNHIIIK